VTLERKISSRDAGVSRSWRGRRRREARRWLPFGDVRDGRGRGFGGGHRPPSRKRRRSWSGGADLFRWVRSLRHSGGRIVGRAPRLPVSVEEERMACPRDRGLHRSLNRSRSRSRSRSRTWFPDHRPSGARGAGSPRAPASSHRRGREGGRFGGCDPTDRTPAACLRAGRADFIVRPGRARLDIVRGASRRRGARPAQCQTPHPEGGSFPSPPVLTTFRFSVLPMLIFL
jgi:hypothetical protein